MYNFKRQYKKMVKDIFKKHGFKLRRISIYGGKTAYRIINDVYQVFFIDYLPRGGRCRIDFAVIPLCRDGINKNYRYSTGCNFELGIFERDMHKEWYYNIFSKSLSENSLNEIKDYMQKYLLKFFQNSTDCQKAFIETDKIEDLYIDSGFDRTRYFNLNRTYMAIKNGDYQEALKGIYAIRDQNISAYEDNMKYFELSDRYKKRYKKDMELYNNLIENMEKNNVEYIKRHCEENEKKALKILV